MIGIIAAPAAERHDSVKSAIALAVLEGTYAVAATGFPLSVQPEFLAFGFAPSLPITEERSS